MRFILHFVVVILFVGCGDGGLPEVAQSKSESAENERKKAPGQTSPLRGSFQVFDHQEGSWTVNAEMNDLEPAEIASFIEKVFEDAGAPPSRVTLKRDEDLFGVGRTRDGRLSLGVTTKVGSEWFEATEYEDVTASSALSVFHAFLSGDDTIRTAVDWDDVVD